MTTRPAPSAPTGLPDLSGLPDLPGLPGLMLVLLVLLSALAPAPVAAAEPDLVGVWPLLPVPEVVAGFDPPDQPWGAGHRGVDLAGVEGQAVRSALPGTVSYAGRLAGRGVVVVSHGSTRTTYEPVGASVSVGDPVAAGQTLGVLERVGGHCPPRACLHWGWLRGADYLDPLGLVGGEPVRLLPLTGLPGPPTARTFATWSPPALPYAGWLPLVRLLVAAEARAREGHDRGPVVAGQARGWAWR